MIESQSSLEYCIKNDKILSKIYMYMYTVCCADSSLFPSADYTLCLDTLASVGSQELYLHLSKPLKEGMRAHNLIQLINKVRMVLKSWHPDGFA